MKTTAIREAVETVLNRHTIVDSGYQGSLRDLSTEQVYNLMFHKLPGNSKYQDTLYDIYQRDYSLPSKALQRELEAGTIDDATYTARLNDASSRTVKSIINAKETYFGDEFMRIDEAIKKQPSLSNFVYDETAIQQERNISNATNEMHYNELQRQLRDYAYTDGGRLSTANINILKENIRDLDYNTFKSLKNELKSMPLEEQERILKDEYEMLLSYQYDVKNMRNEILGYNPKFDFTGIDKKNLMGQYNSLLKYSDKYKQRVVEEQALREELSQMSIEDFSARWNSPNKEERIKAHRAWGKSNPVGYYYGNFYRKGIDDEALAIKRQEAFAATEEYNAQQNAELGGLKVKAAIENQAYRDKVKADIQQKLNEVHNKTGMEFTNAYNSLSAEDRALYDSTFGVHQFKSGGSTYTVKPFDVEHLPPEVQADYTNWVQHITGLQMGDEVRATKKLAQEMGERQGQQLYGDRNVSTFESEVRDTVKQEEQARIWRPSRESENNPETIVKRNNEIVAQSTELNTVGETQVSEIERRAYNSLLANDTASKYVFGYKQNAVLGMMGVIGGTALFEAMINAPDARHVERRKMLEEERRRKQLGLT